MPKLVTNKATHGVSFHGADPRYSFLATEEREVSDEDFNVLKNHPLFRALLLDRNGFTVEGMSRKQAAELSKTPREKVTITPLPKNGVAPRTARSSVSEKTVDLDNWGNPKKLEKGAAKSDNALEEAPKKALFKPVKKAD